MRQESIQIANGNSVATITGAAKDVNQVVNLSVQVYCSGSGVVGILKLQASNDTTAGGALRSQFTPTNWVDINNATATVAAGESHLIELKNIAMGYLRAVWTPDGGGSSGTVSAQMSAVGV